MEKEKETFSYTYSSAQQQELKKIRERYLPPQQNKLDQIRRLDNRASRPGRLVGWLMGIGSLLLFGTGMSWTLVWPQTLFWPGVGIGIAGMIGMVLAYPLAQSITRRQRRKIAPQILKLTEELMQ